MQECIWASKELVVSQAITGTGGTSSRSHAASEGQVTHALPQLNASSQHGWRHSRITASISKASLADKAAAGARQAAANAQSLEASLADEAAARARQAAIVAQKSRH